MFCLFARSDAVRIGLDLTARAFLTADGRVDGLDVELAQVFAVHEVQRLIDVHIAIKEDIAVRRMIVFGMEGGKGFLRQIRDVVRIAARFDAVRRVREEVVHDVPFQLRIRRREDTFHFIVDDAAVGQFAVG